MTEVEQTVRGFITKNFIVARTRGPLGSDVSLMDSGILDSTGALELISFIEAQYNFSVADDELTPENLGTIANIVAYVARKTGAT